MLVMPYKRVQGAEKLLKHRISKTGTSKTGRRSELQARLKKVQDWDHSITSMMKNIKGMIKKRAATTKKPQTAKRVQPTPLLHTARTTVTYSPRHYYIQPAPLLHTAHATITCSPHHYYRPPSRATRRRRARRRRSSAGHNYIGIIII